MIQKERSAGMVDRRQMESGQMEPVQAVHIQAEPAQRESVQTGPAQAEPEKDAGRMIHMVSNQLQRRISVRTEADSLTNMQRRVLHYILFQSLRRDIYQKDVEKEFQIRRSTATGILQLLEKNGFIVRESVERDARLKKLVPTPKAEARREQILGNIRNVEELLTHGISKQDVEVCIRVLEQMSENLLGDEKKKREETKDHE